MRVILKIAFVWLSLAGSGFAAVGFHVALGDGSAQTKGLATLILRGEVMEYRLALGAGPVGGQNRLILEFSEASETLALSPVVEAPVGSGCQLVFPFHGPYVVNGDDLTSFENAIARDAVEGMLAQGLCDALLSGRMSVGTLVLSAAQADRFSRGGFTAHFLDLEERVAIPSAIQRWAGAFLDVSGVPVGGLDIHFWRPNGVHWEHRVARTAANGTWAIDLPVGGWRGAARPDELLARGYFCEPGSFLQWSSTCLSARLIPENGLFEVLPCDPLVGTWSEPLWGLGAIEWQQVTLEGLENQLLVAVPTRPLLEVKKRLGEAADVEVSFETQTTLPMQLTRKWRIERSGDLRAWEPMETVELGQVSPLQIQDPASASRPQAFYRAVYIE
jgi:hypothetical protein